ncbi:hypothetical protein BJ170DRAFT_37879 [Xylariales sp. AK1849]|nr:hypothetical protein BJ170DRAFT_37879 [Xylariales sp. AK1849]
MRLVRISSVPWLWDALRATHSGSWLGNESWFNNLQFLVLESERRMRCRPCDKTSEVRTEEAVITAAISMARHPERSDGSGLGGGHWRTPMQFWETLLSQYQDSCQGCKTWSFHVRVIGNHCIASVSECWHLLVIVCNRATLNQAFGSV